MPSPEKSASRNVETPIPKIQPERLPHRRGVERTRTSEDARYDHVTPWLDVDFLPLQSIIIESRADQNANEAMAILTFCESTLVFNYADCDILL